MDKNYVINIFKEQWLSKAGEYIHTPEKIQKLIPEIKDYVAKNGLKDIKDKVYLIIDYLRDVSSGKYQDYSAKSLLMLVAGMIYLLTPLDVIPDILPIMGFADDAAVIAWLFKEMNNELDKYKELNK